MTYTAEDTLLMKKIRVSYGAQIAQVCKSSSVPPEFLAALVANESGGNSNAKRFEKGVLASLWAVLQGRAAAFGSIGRADLYSHIAAAVMADGSLPALSYDAGITCALRYVDSLATSWGLTQIMGYEAIALGVSLDALQNPNGNLQAACRMLAEFAQRFGLDICKDFAELMDCWNTGRPHGAPTADPQYVPNGIARLTIYRALGDDPPKSISA